MASSQVEFASSSPFGCALRRDHSHRTRCTAVPFKNNLNDLVSTCISDDNSNPRHHIDYTDLWVHQPQWQTAPSSVSASPDNNVIIRKNNDEINKKNENDHGKIKANDEDKWARAREMVFAGDRKSRGRVSSGACSVFKRENSPTQSEPPVEIPNLRGVSSLVQKWRDFEAEAKCLQSNSPLCSTRSNSSTTLAENVSCIDVPSRHSDVCDERPVTNEETFEDWESDRMASSGPPSSMGRDSDATERERLRVVDIIRKLTSSTEDNNEREHIASCESSPLVRTSLDQSEQSCFSSVLSSPRIRGRGAFNNLLAQMESERHKELEGLVARKAVSKFSQRGRIQALLRVRFLRRGLEAKEGRQVNNTSFEFKKFTQSAITHIRERFKSGVQNRAIDSKNSQREVVNNAASVENMLNQPGTQNQHQETNKSLIPDKVLEDHILDVETSSTSQETSGSIISRKVIADHILEEETSSTTKRHEVELISHCVNENIQQSSLQAHGSDSEHLHQEASPLSDIMWPGTGCKANNRDLAASTEAEEPLIDVNKNKHAEEETSNQQLTRTNHDLIDDCAHPEDEWEELHSDYQHQEENNTDWISDISRPRSDWEDLRQARYCEMLDPFLENKDIPVLLERRSVSTFLSSGLRDRIDQLMMSRTQQPQLNVKNNLMEERRQEQVIEEEDKGEDGVAALEEEEEEEEDEEDEERSYSDYYNEYEDESDIGQQYNDCIDQSESSEPHSWLHNQGHEISDDSYRAASPSEQPSLSSNTYSLDNRHLSSFTNHHTIEMDLINDLREQMEQLHQEMSELRRSIKSCVNMQVKLQHSIKQDAAALSHSDRKKRKDSTNKGPSKGRCSICCEMQVDSVLYRCGHMCTCFKCAHELQWNSGKCPLCGAQILDVVCIRAR
ncbi:uncharacterized protein LOC111389825 [Olea europaea var. sylvestris]|uniref:uncharacterized protein LOC111389825 n=1 Tax=Olea europaea var. sylvestris TaxID=158386 RepID=UPI000C1D603A|nr:uncharacterized protein LOC111389825 [Olea europaea var. sylvestris]